MTEPRKPLFNRTYLKIILWVVAIAVVLLNWKHESPTTPLTPWHWQAQDTSVVALKHEAGQSEVWVLSFASGAQQSPAGLAAIADEVIRQRLNGGAKQWFLSHEISFSTALTQEAWKIILRLPADDQHRQLAREGLATLFTPDASDQVHYDSILNRFEARSHLRVGQSLKTVALSAIEALYPDQPLGQPLRGTSDTLENLTEEAVLAHITHWWATQPYRLVLLGDADEAQMHSTAQALLKSLGDTPPQPFVPAKDNHFNATHLDIHKPQLSQQAAIALPLLAPDAHMNLELRLWLTQRAAATHLGAEPWHDSQRSVLIVSWQGDLHQTPPDWKSWLSARATQAQLDDIQKQISQARDELNTSPESLARWLDLMMDRGQSADALQHWAEHHVISLQEFNDELAGLTTWGSATLHP